jgi:hypothetical protein
MRNEARDANGLVNTVTGSSLSPKGEEKPLKSFKQRKDII